jgi:hypothetical protein
MLSLLYKCVCVYMCVPTYSTITCVHGFIYLYDLYNQHAYMQHHALHSHRNQPLHTILSRLFRRRFRSRRTAAPPAPKISYPHAATSPDATASHRSPLRAQDRTWRIGRPELRSLQVILGPFNHLSTVVGKRRVRRLPCAHARPGSCSAETGRQ